MRTTVRMDDHLIGEAKAYAEQTGRTLTRLLEDAVREHLGRRRGPRKVRERPTLPTFGGRGLQPGVDLDDTASLLDLMDRGDAAP